MGNGGPKRFTSIFAMNKKSKLLQNSMSTMIRINMIVFKIM